MELPKSADRKCSVKSDIENAFRHACAESTDAAGSVLLAALQKHLTPPPPRKLQQHSNTSLSEDGGGSHSSITTAASAEDLTTEEFAHTTSVVHRSNGGARLSSPSDPFEAAELHKAEPLIPVMPPRSRRAASTGNVAAAKRRVLSPSANGVVASADVVLFLDWDDTLFPSTWLHLLQRSFCRGGDEDEEEDLSLDVLASTAFTPEEQDQLETLDAYVYEFLQECRKHARLFIVTNAEAGWVEQTASRFMPHTYDWLLRKQIPIISARACYNQLVANSPTPSPFDEQRLVDSELSPPDLWKAHTFNMLVRNVIQDRLRRRHRRFGAAGDRSSCEDLSSEARRACGGIRSKLHFISVGDSECERRAMLKCREDYYIHGFFKSIKLLEGPDLALLLQQQQFLHRHICQLITTLDCLDLLIDPSVT